MKILVCAAGIYELSSTTKCPAAKAYDYQTKDQNSGVRLDPAIPPYIFIYVQTNLLWMCCDEGGAIGVDCEGVDCEIFRL